jgi:hypothetical protein
MLAKGKYIARMDADDISLPNRLELQYNLLNKHKDLIITFSRFNWINRKGINLLRPKEVTSPEAIYYQLQFRNFLAHPTVIYNKNTVVNEFGGYNEKCEAEDNDLWLRLSKKYRIVKIDKVLLKVRRTKQSKTVLLRKELNDSVITITQNNLQSLIGKPIKADIVSVLADINQLSYPPQKIKEALVVLCEVNVRILEHCPLYINKSIIKISMKNKENWVRLCMLTATLFNSKPGSFFKAIYRLYRSIFYPF